MMTKSFIFVLVISILGNLVSPIRADEASRKPLKAGDKLPAFSSTDLDGITWNSTDQFGDGILVIYFFSSAFTSSATKEAVQFREDLKELGDRKIQLVGISGDKPETLKLFSETNELNFKFLSDADGKIAGQFGLAIGKGGSITKTIDRKKQTFTRDVTLPRRVFAINNRGRVTTTRFSVESLKDLEIVFDLLARDFWAKREDRKAIWQPKTDSDWKRVLTREQYQVARKGKTEIPFFNRYWNSKAKGAFRCACCGEVLFQSDTKFRSGTGWPSFWSPAAEKAIAYARDTTNGMTRVEVKCKQCDAHLGHVFADGPPPTGKRYCMNSAALVLDTKNSGKTVDPEKK